jgi:uncharacterized protein (TIGR03435 family)
MASLATNSFAAPIFAVALPIAAQTNGAHGPAATQLENPGAKLPQFEVATIKPVDPNVRYMVGIDVYPGGRVVLRGLPLKTLICIAFNVSYWQLSGGDSWTGKTFYNVEAIPPENLRSRISDLRHTLFGIEDEHLRQMLQALLLDRFQLTFHRETKTGKVFLLERKDKTLRLQPTKAISATTDPMADTGGSIGFAEEWVLYNTTMPELAKFASDFLLHCPVLDRTDLPGSFDYKSPPEDWDTYQQDPVGSFLNLIGEMGLKLDSEKGPVETFVIDQAHTPSPN